MPERQIRYFGDPVLKTVTEPVTVFDGKLKDLVRDLLDTTNMEGRAGVAANQIGSTRRVFAYHVEGQLGYVINPQIHEVGGELREVDEGCLSVPGLHFPTPRWERALVTGVDWDNNPVVVEGEGLMAQMLQHEVDHLDGFVYLDRLSKEQRRAAMRAVRESDWF